jgi:DNA-binding MarR family transcriptional regulator
MIDVSRLSAGDLRRIARHLNRIADRREGARPEGLSEAVRLAVVEAGRETPGPIARLVGSRREDVDRVLRRLEREGRVRREGRRPARWVAP